MNKETLTRLQTGVTQLRPPHVRLSAGLLIMPALVYVGVLYVWPLTRMFVRSFSQSDDPLAHFRRILGTALYTDSLIRTFEYSALATVGSLILGYPLAYLMRVARPGMRLVLIALVIVPFFVALLVRTFGWMVILGRTGPIARLSELLTGETHRILYTPLAVQVGMVAILLPFMVLPLYSIMATIDLRLLQAARVMGASSVAAFLTIFLPLTLSGVLAGVVLVFMLGIGFFITPDLLGSNSGQVYATLMVRARETFAGTAGFTEAMAVILLVVTLATLAISSRIVPLSRVWGGATLQAPGQLTGAALADPQGLRSSQPTARARTWRNRLGRAAADHVIWPFVRGTGRIPGRIAAVPWVILAGIAIVVLDAPIVVALLISFGEDIFLSFPPQQLTFTWYGEFVETGYWIDALLTSLLVGVLTALVTTTLGSLTALGLVRAEFPGKNAVISLLMSPLIIPSIISGIAIYYFFFPIGLVGTIQGLVLAHSLGSLPIVTVIMAANLRNFDVRLEQAARVLGASSIQAFRHVTLPLIRPGIAAAAFFAFLGSFDELTYALFLAGVRLRTLPIRLWEDLHFRLSPMLAVVSVVEIVVVILVLLVTHFLTKSRRSGREAV